jgi:hypothetical protein
MRWLRTNPGTLDIGPPLSHTDSMPRTAILYARSNRRENLDRQVRELEDWCDALALCRSARSPRSRSVSERHVGAGKS